MEIILTDNEKKAIRALKRLAKIWPKTLWLFSANGNLNIMRFKEDGEQGEEKKFGGMDCDYLVDSIGHEIPNDGGDW